MLFHLLQLKLLKSTYDLIAPKKDLNIIQMYDWYMWDMKICTPENVMYIEGVHIFMSHNVPIVHLFCTICFTGKVNWRHFSENVFMQAYMTSYQNQY